MPAARLRLVMVLLKTGLLMKLNVIGLHVNREGAGSKLKEKCLVWGGC